jgi:hypothetical protein
MQDRDAEVAIAPPPSRNLVELLGWVASRPRTYAETMEAWRTSCPRLSVWEDATGDDLVRVEQAGAASQGQAVVQLTDRGAALLLLATSVVVGSGSAVRGDVL